MADITQNNFEYLELYNKLIARSRDHPERPKVPRVLRIYVAFL
jgi:hypothetical protein